jgi:hypothetical protein
MTVLVSVETVLLILLVVLVAGLLRSHAELLRRLGPGPVDGAPGGPAPAVLRDPGASAVSRDPGAPAPALSGRTPAGDAVSLSFDAAAAAPTLLAFLSTGCSTCTGFWEELGEHRLPPGVQTVIVTRGAELEQPARLRKLAPAEVPVVMSTVAWQQYAVPGAPYFVLVERSVRGEGVATTWQALSSLVTDAIEDGRLAAGKPVPRRNVDETLTASGIGPDHPSLYPAGRPAP